MTITNLAAFDAAIRAVCPAIDGVAADGYIFFQPSATPAQIAAAKQAASTYVDPPPAPVLSLPLLVQALQTAGVLSPAAVATLSVQQPAQLATPVLAAPAR